MSNIIRFGGGGNVSEDIVLLYNNGVETVPWSVSGATKQTDHILIAGQVNRYAETTNNVDVSVYKKMYIEADIRCTNTDASSAAAHGLVAGLGATAVGKFANWFAPITTYRRYIISCDLSLVASSGKPRLTAIGYGSANTAEIKVYKVWLEK